VSEASWKTLTTRKVIFGLAGLLCLAVGGLWLIDPDAFPIGPYTEAEPPNPVPADDGKARLSEAERIARLQRSIDTQRKYLEKLTAELNDPDNEYHKSEKSFQDVDAERQKVRREIDDLKAAGKTAEAAKRETALQEIEPRWKQEEERFNLALKEHKTLQESIDAATKQLHSDQQTLARLTGDAQGPKPEDSGRKNESSSVTRSPSSAVAEPAAKPAEKAEKTPSLVPVPSSPFALASSASAASGTPSAPSTPAARPADALSREVERAQVEAKKKEEAAQQAESRAQSITERIDILNQNISTTKRLLETARQEAAEAQRNKDQLDEQLKQKRAANAPEAELQDLTRRVEQAGQQVKKERGEADAVAVELHELQNRLTDLQQAQIRALRDAQAKKEAAEAADERIAWLQNPFRPRNMVHWLLHHGPRLLLIALGMFLFHRLSRGLSRRAVQLLSQGASKRGTLQDRENRAQTLAGVFNSALSLLVLGGGTLMMLDAVGIPIVPLMGGAAVLGLAVAFGAQNLIKDYFSGFMVLLEDQYGINDVVKIGDTSGLVEHISLRTTVLRDLEGTVHFIPHGTITTVSNQTHGWSRALFDVGIDYKEDTDRVMEVLLELGRELRRDPAYAPLILDDPEMLGVDNLADSSVVLKFFVKTRPLQQWTVKREMLRRIKKRFDELGIEIPYPHQTVHHRYDSPPPPGQPESPPFSRVA
jgi:small-conductance mechanosensitive channel/predicted  nucleic acid-binding Zn-ribbon protein